MDFATTDYIDADGYLFHDKKGAPVATPVASSPFAETHGHLVTMRHMPAHVALTCAALAGVRLMVTLADPVEDVEDVDAFEHWLDDTREQSLEALRKLEEAGIAAPQFEGFERLGALPDQLYFLAGTHPYGSEELMASEAARERLARLLAHERCVGVGEFGIDYGPHNQLPPEIQHEAFRYQLRLAHELNMPVELHLRDADGDTQYLAHRDAERILREEGVPKAGCDLHCFTVGPDVMEPFVEMGCHVAFGGAVTFSRSDDVRDAACICPQDRLLSETDCPYMTPVPLRGQCCEPAMVSFAAACVAQTREERGIAPAEQTYRALWDNALDFFALDALR